MGGLPTGVVTFVLTDVVGSTELWERAPDAMATAIARHDEIVRDVVSTEDGVLLKTKGEGDSTFSVFGRTSDGLRAAYRMQRAMRVERWPAGARIRTRVAVHTGEAVERNGDYFGPAVNLVARLRGAAQGGQILVSAATATIGRKHLPRGCDLVDVGPIVLRGITDPESAWALAAADLDSVAGAGAGRRGRSVAGDRDVSRREAEVHTLVGENLTNAEIASRLYISERTVESHVSSLLRKLGAADRRELARRPRAAVPVVALGGGAAERPALPAILELHADPSSFVGRAAEREALRGQWQLARAGHTLLVVVSGEAGIGKSRLVSELAVEVHADGGRVLFGACFEDVDEPYGPFAQAISDEVADLAGAKVDGLVEEDREALALLSPQLARALSVRDAVAHRGEAGLTEQGVVFDAIERWLFAVAAAPALLVVEDLHWSTSSTRDLLRHLVRRAGRRPLLLVATSRDTPPDLGTELSALLGDVERSPAVTRVQLGGLDRDDVAALLETSSADAEAIVAETGGNPLLVTHVTAAGHGGSLSALLDRREELLDGEARAVLDLAATLGAEFNADVLAAGHGAPLLSVLESLERAESAGLVVPLPGRPGRFGFVHALFRAHRYDRLPTRRRLELHASAAAALAARPGDDRLSERARHTCLAVPITDARTALELAREAAHAAEHAYAYDEAASHYRRALDAARSLDPPDPRSSLDLTVRLAAALHYHGDAEGMPMLLDAADRARREGDDAALVRVAMAFAPFGASGNFAGANTAQISVVEDALAAVGPEPSATRARLLIELTAQIGDVRVDESVELARQAEAIAREIGDVDVLGRVLLGARLLGRHPSRLEEYERIGRQLEELGSEQRTLALTLAGIFDQAEVHLQRGELQPWVNGIERARRLLGDRSLGFFQLFALSARAKRAFLEGDLEAAQALTAPMGPLAAAIGHPPGIWTGGTRVIVGRMQARDSEMIAALDRTAPRGAFSVAPFNLAASQARIGSTDEALRTLTRLRADGYPMPLSHGWTMAMTELAEAAEVAGDAESAAFVLAECSPYSGRIAVAGPCVNRPFDQALAQAALAVGDAVLAEQYVVQAVAASRERRTPLYLARELVFLAEARRRVGSPLADVRPLVDEAMELADRFGAPIVAVDIERYGLRA